MLPNLKTTTPIGKEVSVWRGGLPPRTMPVHTGELGLRIAWNVWRNDKYPDWSPIPGQLCRYIVITVGDQHGRLSECWRLIGPMTLIQSN